MGRIRRHPPRESHRLRRDRAPERYRLVHRSRMDRHSHLVSEAETEHGILRRYRVYGNSPHRVDLRDDLEEVERDGGGTDQVTPG